jgi:RNA polymerase sigma factor (sigma-70 family)
MEPDAHLFRRESGRMVAALTRIFGLHNLELVEDVVQEAFCRAIEVWRFRGVPENPPAWLMATAKNCALDVLRRERTARDFAPELEHHLRSEWTLPQAVEELFGADAIKDDLLRMMFSCCHPRLAEEAQVALVLQILCGFGVDEVASAFVTTHSAMEKRITRAKKVLAGAKKLFDVAAPADLLARLPAVQRALYLLFNEGYHGASSEVAVRAELCREAMRLTAVLLANRVLATPATYALAALMSLDAARLPARIDAAGNLNSLTEQDRSLWDKSLVTEGLAFLELSARGSELSEYHVEAAIASIHATAVETGSTDWRSVVSLYDTLMAVRPSPVIALNRAIAIGQLEGPRRGMDEIRAIRDSDRLAKYPFYEAAQGEFELLRNNHAAASTHFRAAMVLARNAMERRFFKQRVSSSEKGIQ